MTETPTTPNLADDLISGMKQIAQFWGMEERKAYHLASTGQLPGVFRIGKGWFGSKSAARDAVRTKAAGSAR
jgi:predicted DNA-binding transcriptional regulator AlpA